MINKLIEIEMIIKKTSLLGKSWENLEGCIVKKKNKKIKKMVDSWFEPCTF
jgi:hypothetical protein